MSHLSPSLPPVTSFPITRPDDLILAWHWFEIGEQRTALVKLRDQNRLPGYSLRAQLDEFEQWKLNAMGKLRDYRASVAQQLAKQDLAMPSDLDELPKVVARCGNSPGLLCHLGMLKAYLALSTCTMMAMSRTSSPAKSLEDTIEDVTCLEYSLFSLLFEAGRRAAAGYREAGYPVDDWFLVGNPFGWESKGPCWVVDPPDGLDDDSAYGATGSVH